MANVLKVHMKQTVLTLAAQGHSNREISRLTGVHRNTVNKYVSERNSKCAISTAGSPGRRSACEAFRAVIEPMLEQGLSAQRIYQELTADNHFTASYESVKRFVRRLTHRRQLPFRRMECAPGVEAQVDFGRGAPITQNGRRRYPHVLRIVLSHSRKAYSEVVYRQTTESFIRVLENAFRHFGGVPNTLVIDNLKAAVKQCDWFDPELNPKVVEFCHHYATTMLPTRPRMPRHKGKVESSVKYVQNNALKGKSFASLATQNAYLLHWEETIADTRIHGTTREQVRTAFEKERSALKALPVDLFACFEESKRTVQRDGYVQVDKAYYSVPPEYTRQLVWVRYDLRTVRSFNHRFEQIALHAKAEPGRFQTTPSHICRNKINSIERGAAYQLRQVSFIGKEAHEWAQAMLKNRGVQGLRTLQGLRALARRHNASAINQACSQALQLDAFYLRQLRQLLKHPAHQQELTFLDDHELIRDLKSYNCYTKDAFAANSEKTKRRKR